MRTAESQAPSGSDCWGLQFGYDIWGNMLSASVSKCIAPMLSQNVNVQNRLAGYSYDAAGNMLNDGAYAYTWDAESRIKSAAGATYIYDGDGERVAKSTGKLYWTGGGSEPLAESDATGNITDEFIFFGGKRIARRDASGNVYYFLADHLGTARVVTNASGVIVQESDHYPFGGERVIVNAVDNRYKSTGKERDAETGNDYFGARFYAPRMRRWLSPDWSSAPVAVPYVDFSNPQSLNLYAYVENNPITSS